MKSAVRSHLAAVMFLAPLSAAMLAQPAAAQHRAVVAPAGITSMALNSSAGLAPGAVLRVQLYATPGARNPGVVLGNSGVRVALRERTPGNYVGTYTIRRGDRIDPHQLVAARATYGGRVVAQNFSFPPSFQALAMGAPAAAAPAPVIERFVLRAPGRLEPGRELRFRLRGAPGGDAWVDIPGVIRGVDLAESRPGVYEGTYTVRRRDDLRAFANARGVLQNGNQRATAKVDVRGGDRDRDVGARRDESPPDITNLMPAEGQRISDRGRAHIFARLADEGSGVDPATVRLRIDGRDVTPRTSITAEEVRFREDLDRGRHTAELVVGDKAGNVVKKSWTFRVVNRDRRG